MAKLTPLKAIRAKCLDCCCGKQRRSGYARRMIARSMNTESARGRKTMRKPATFARTAKAIHFHPQTVKRSKMFR